MCYNYLFSGKALHKLQNSIQTLKKVAVEEKGSQSYKKKKKFKNDFLCDHKGELISKEQRERMSDHDTCYMYFFEYMSKKCWYNIRNK